MERQRDVFFDGWEGLADVLVCAPVLYVVVVLGVRLSGKRTTGQMNNFDWIVTVAMGSIVASGIVINTVSLAEAGLAVATLLALQYAVTLLAKRNERFDRLMKADPSVLVARGVIQEDALRRSRVTREELNAALRGEGIARIDEVGWMILENDGTFSVIARDAAGRSDGTVVPDELGAA